jgi:hypothetical protein
MKLNGRYFSVGPTLLFVLLSGYSKAQFISFDGTKTHYEMQGYASPVVLIHGYIVDGST